MTSTLSVMSLEAQKLRYGKYSLWYSDDYIWCSNGVDTYKMKVGAGGGEVVPYDPTVDKSLLPYEDNLAIDYKNQTVSDALYSILTQVIQNQKDISNIQPVAKYDPTKDQNFLPYIDLDHENVSRKVETVDESLYLLAVQVLWNYLEIKDLMAGGGGGATGFDPTVNLNRLPYNKDGVKGLEIKSSAPK